MAAGDIGYDRLNKEWVFEEEDGSFTPLIEAPDAILAAMGRILASYTGEITDENLWDLKEAAKAQAMSMLQSGQVGASGQQAAAGGGANQLEDIPPRPPGWVGPWPIMTEAIPEKEVFQNGEYFTQPAVPSEPDWARMNAAINTLGLAYAQDPTTGEWEYQRQSDLLKTAPSPAPLIFGTKAEAEAEAALNGGVVVRRSDGRWGVEDAPPEQMGQTAQQPSFEEEFNRLIFSGQEKAAEALWNLRKRITEGGGYMTRAEAAQFLTGDLFKAEEIPALLQALMGPEPTFQEAARLPGPAGEPGNVDIGGFFGPTRDAPFPAFPQEPGFPGMAPEPAGAPLGPAASSDAVTAAFQAQDQGGQPQSFTQAIQADLAAVTKNQRTQVQAAAASAPRKGPLFTGVNPQAQAEWEAEGGQGPAPVFQAPARQPVDTAGLEPGANEQAQREWEAEGGQGPAPVFQTAPAATPAATPAAALAGAPAGWTTPAWFPAAYEAQGGAGRKGVFQVPEDMNPWDAAIALSQTPEGLAQAEAIRNATPEQRGIGVEQTEESLAAAAATQPRRQGLTFAEALAQVNQRRQHQRLVRQPRGRTIFT